MQTDLPLDDAPRAVRFTLCTEIDAGLLPRMLQTLARRDITPHRVTAKRIGDRLHVEIVLREAPMEDCHLVHGNLRQLVGVHSLQREDTILPTVAPRLAPAPAFEPPVAASDRLAWHLRAAHNMQASAVAGGISCLPT